MRRHLVRPSPASFIVNITHDPERAVMTGQWSRVTVQGGTRRANLSLPTHAPVGRLLADLVTLLDEPRESDLSAMVLTTSSGFPLDSDTSLAGGGIQDGSTLYLTRRGAVPPAPVVGDITEELVSALATNQGLWTPVGRAVAAVVLAVLAAGTTGAQLMIGAPTQLTSFILGCVGVAIWVSSAVLARLRRRWLSAAGYGSGWALCSVVAAAGIEIGSWTWFDRCLLIAALATLAVGMAELSAWQTRAFTLGAAVGAALSGGWLLMRFSALSPAETESIVAVAAVLLLGILPRIALTTAGLTKLDDAQFAGGQVSRSTLSTSLASAHATVIASTVAAALAGGAAGIALAVGYSGPWSLGLAGATATVVALRARNFPLVIEGATVLLWSAAVFVSLLTEWSIHYSAGRTLAVIGGSAVAVSLAVHAELTLPEHLQARLRQVGERMETLAMLAILPCLVGAFGVFSRLLQTF